MAADLEAAGRGAEFVRRGAQRALAGRRRAHGRAVPVDPGELAGGAQGPPAGYHFTTGGRLIRYASGSASVLKPKRVPRSYTRLNSTYRPRFTSSRSRAAAS